MANKALLWAIPFPILDRLRMMRIPQGRKGGQWGLCHLIYHQGQQLRRAWPWWQPQTTESDSQLYPFQHHLSLQLIEQRLRLKGVCKIKNEIYQIFTFIFAITCIAWQTIQMLQEEVRSLLAGCDADLTVITCPQQLPLSIEEIRLGWCTCGIRLCQFP